MSSNDRILDYLEDIIESDNCFKKRFNDIKCTIDSGVLHYLGGSEDPLDFSKELSRLLMVRIREEIADECKDAIEREIYELDMKEQGFYQTATHGEVVENIMKIIKGVK